MADQDIPLASMPDMQDVPLAGLMRALRSGQLSAQPVNQAAAAVGNLFAPNLTDYLRNGPSPQSLTPYPSGKLPSTDPRFTAAVQDVGNMVATAPMGALGPEGATMARFAEGVAPRLALQRALPGAAEAAGRDVAPEIYKAAGAASGIAPAPAMAGATPIEGPGERPTAEPDELKQIDALQNQIGALTQQRAKATKNLGPKGAAVQGQPYDAQITQLNNEIATINGQVANRQNLWDQQKAEFDKQTAPFAARNPEEAAALRFAPLLSLATGGWVGRTAGGNPSMAKRTAAYVAGGAGGGLEGLVGGYYPTLQDAGMPRGTAAKAEANANNADPNFWKYDIAPEVGMGTALGLLGTKYGMLSRATQPAVSPLAKALVTSSNAKSAAATAGADVERGVFFSKKSGAWHEQGTGRFLPADDPRIPPSSQP